MRFHHDVCLIVYSIEVLLKMMLVIFFAHFCLEFVIVAVYIFIVGHRFLSEGETTHFLVVFGEVVPAAGIRTDSC